MKTTAPAYLVGNFSVNDPVKMGAYVAQAGAIIQRHGGRMLAMTAKASALEGETKPNFAIIEFPSLKQATDFYNDPDYAPMKQLRISATTPGFLLIQEGLSA